MVASYARGINYRLGQLSAQAQAPIRVTHKQALHFACVWIVTCTQRPHGAATCHGAICQCEQQGTLRLGVLARQCGKLVVKILKAQVNARLRCIFTENYSRGLQLLR